MNKLEQAAMMADEWFAWYQNQNDVVKTIDENDVISALHKALGDFWRSRTLATIRSAKARKQADKDPVAFKIEIINKHGEHETHIDWNLENWNYVYATPLYAIPIHTKDLTDAFINELHKDAQDPISFARAVIKADRKLSK